MGNEKLEDDVILISVSEACRITRIGRNTMLKLVKRKDFPVLKLKHKYLIDRMALPDWIRKNYGELKL